MVAIIMHNDYHEKVYLCAGAVVEKQCKKKQGWKKEKEREREERVATDRLQVVIK
jgi:hypothetical protein